MKSETIKLTTEATPQVAEKRIKAAIKSLLNPPSADQHYTVEWEDPIEVREGSEKCGSGDLFVTGTVRQWDGISAMVEFRLENNQSRWKNYGAPHGAKYEIETELVRVGIL